MFYFPRRVTAAVLLLSCGIPAATAQQASPQTGVQPVAAPAAKARPSLFRQVISQPTGKNGYEELVLAAEAFRASRYYEKAQEVTSLQFKREVLADRQVVRALALLRQGLQKPVLSPREKLTFTTLLPEFSEFRSLSRLLALQQYVLLADGRTGEAIQNARLGLKFSQAIQTDTLIAGLVGLAMSAVCLRPLSDHMDQLSARDCEALFQVCLEWLAQPNPQDRVMMADRHWMKEGLVEMRERIKKDGVRAAVQQFGLTDHASDQALAQVPTTPEGVDALFVDIGKRLEAHWVRVFAELRKPSWERTAVHVPEEKDLAGSIASFLIPVYDRVDERYVREAARMRLLACHCLIRRYRWEHNQLPSSLAEVQPGELAIDPFSGQPLQYQVRGNRYSLTSVGAPAMDPDDPKAVNGRVPVALTPDD